MEAISITIIMILTLFILLILSVPISISIGISSLVAVLYTGELPLSALAQKYFTSMDSFPIMAIPFFIVAGTIMEHGGISKRLIEFANSIVGSFHGGLGMVVVLGSMIFGAMSGSGIATTAALGSILIPSMIKQGYDRGFAGATAAISGELGIIIPPSITMIVFGVTAGVSVGDMFIAGILPGVMVGLSLILVVYIISKLKGYKGTSIKYSFKDRLIIIRNAIPALFMPVIILGGIYSGIFTPTEAAAISIAYAMLVSLFVYKEIKIKDLFSLFTKSIYTSAAIMYIMANAGLFSWVLSRESIPQTVSLYFTELSSNPFIFLLAVNLLLIVIGMFIDGLTAIVIVGPLLVPAAVSLGIDPVHFGIIMIVNLALGMCTPPVGVTLFVANQIAETRLATITKSILPFLFVMIINLLILSYLPQISLFLLNFLD